LCVYQSGGIERLCDILCDGARPASHDEVTQQSVQHGAEACRACGQSERVSGEAVGGACRSHSQSERVRSEAAGVFAQITSPSLILSSHIDEMRRASLRTNMPDLVPALTGTYDVVSKVSSVTVLVTNFVC